MRRILRTEATLSIPRVSRPSMPSRAEAAECVRSSGSGLARAGLLWPVSVRRDVAIQNPWPPHGPLSRAVGPPNRGRAAVGGSVPDLLVPRARNTCKSGVGPACCPRGCRPGRRAGPCRSFPEPNYFFPPALLSPCYRPGRAPGLFCAPRSHLRTRSTQTKKPPPGATVFGSVAPVAFLEPNYFFPRRCFSPCYRPGRKAENPNPTGCCCERFSKPSPVDGAKNLSRVR